MEENRLSRIPATYAALVGMAKMFQTVPILMSSRGFLYLFRNEVLRIVVTSLNVETIDDERVRESMVRFSVIARCPDYEGRTSRSSRSTSHQCAEAVSRQEFDSE